VSFLIYITEAKNLYKQEVAVFSMEKEVKKIKEAVAGEEGRKEPKLTDLPGIGPAVSSKLEAAGIYDMMSLAVMSPNELGNTAGVSPAVARKAIQAARTMLDLGFSDGLEYAEKRKNISYITTGSKNLDGLLGGRGVESRSVTEAFGAYGSGKTQLGSTLAVNVQLPPDKGGASGKCVFIDTEGTFRPARIKQIAEGLGASSDKVLKNIFVARAFNSDHQMLLLEKVSEMIKNGEPIKLLIIDSLTAHFRAEFSGRGQLADRQQKLNRYMHDLMKLAETYNLAVYVTNQVMANPAQMFGDPTTAIGGHIVGHASTYRIYLRRGKKGSRVAKMIDSPNLPDNETEFFVSDKGIIDSEE
jgi:DNA repair protein RadA